MMDTSQKTPLGRSLNQLAEQRARDAIQQTGKCLPASVVSVSGSIAKVKFEVQGTTLPEVTIPVASSEYVRLPLQVGDQGLVVSSDAYLGGVSGLGGGTASLQLPANLSALVFIPIGNKGFDPVSDPNRIVLYGPNGAVLRTKDRTVSVTVSETGVTITAGAFAWIFSTNGTFSIPNNINLQGSILGPSGGTYAGGLQTSGEITAGVGSGASVGLRTHTHTSGNPGDQTSAPRGGT